MSEPKLKMIQVFAETKDKVVAIAKKRKQPIRRYMKELAEREECELDKFEDWWHEIGSAPKNPGEDAEEHTKRIAMSAWNKAGTL